MSASSTAAAVASKPLRPCRLLVTALREHGPQRRDELWELVRSTEDCTIKSKTHMKKVMRELTRRKVINARVDVRQVQEIVAGQHSKQGKHLSAKNTPSYIFKLRNTKRYKD